MKQVIVVSTAVTVAIVVSLSSYFGGKRARVGEHESLANGQAQRTQALPRPNRVRGGYTSPVPSATSSAASQDEPLHAPAGLPVADMVRGTEDGTVMDRKSAPETGGEETVFVHGEQLSLQELTFRIEAKYQDDEPGDRIGRDLEYRIATQFAEQEVPEVALRVAECRSKLCKIEMMADTSLAANQMFQSLYRGALLTAGGAVAPVREVLPDGKVRMVMYVARQGEVEVF